MTNQPKNSNYRYGEPGRTHKVLLYVLLVVGGLTMVIPFLWMMSTSLKHQGEVFTRTPQWLPWRTEARIDGDWYGAKSMNRQNDQGERKMRIIEKGRYQSDIHWVAEHDIRRTVSPRWRNYSEVWEVVRFGRFYLNSIFIAFCVTFGQLVTASLAGFSFARLRFPGRDKIFLAYLATMMIPGSVTLIPLFIVIKKIGWMDTYWALIVPWMFTPYGTFLLRQFFMSLPSELEDAAKIDGCSLFSIYWRIALPLSKPALATLGIFTFMGSWGSFMWPLIVIHSTGKNTLPIGLAAFQGQYTTNYPLLMAGSMMVVLPIIVIFVCCQRFFVEGIKLSGMGGR